MNKRVIKNAASKPSSPATYPFGVQWYCPFEPTTATKTLNWITFKMNCKGASYDR